MDIFCTTPASLTWRAHDSLDSVANRSGPLDMSSLPIDVLKAEKVGRISGTDLINLLEIGKLLCLDIRPAEEFKLGSLANSINLPALTAFTPDGELNGAKEGIELARRAGKVIAILGSAKDKAIELKVAEELLRLRFPRISTLHGGIEVFRNSGLLVVPNV